jgi:hypothetical protein
MAEISFDLAALFERTFGYKTEAFSPEFGRVQGDNSSFRINQGAHGSSYYAKDSLGVEYYMPVTLVYPDNGQSTEQGVSNPSISGQLKKWDLPYPVISITSRKTIIETPLTERRGTVKELINIQNYEIVVKGFIISNTNEFPENAVTTLRTIYELNIPLSIQCPLTDIFLLRPDRSGSDQVILQEIKFPVISGVKSVRPYELHFVSDEPFNLISIS